MTEENTAPPTFSELQSQIAELQKAAEAAYLRETGLPAGWRWESMDRSPSTAVDIESDHGHAVWLDGAEGHEHVLFAGDDNAPATVVVAVLRKAGLLPAEGPSARDAIVALYRRQRDKASNGAWADDLCDLFDLDNLEIRKEAYSK